MTEEFAINESQIIELGFTPFAGGTQPPEDWDGGHVLLRVGCQCAPENIPTWEHGPLCLPATAARPAPRRWEKH